MALTGTHTVPFLIGTFVGGDEAYLQSLTFVSMNFDTNVATYAYAIRRYLSSNPSYALPELVEGTCEALADPAPSPGDPIQAVRDAENITP